MERDALALGRSWLRIMEEREPRDSLEGRRDLGGLEVEEVRLRRDRREAERPSPDGTRAGGQERMREKYEERKRK